MPVQIDHMDTSIEIMPSSPSSSPPRPAGGVERQPGGGSDPRAREALRELVGQVMADELDRFMRNRGM